MTPKEIVLSGYKAFSEGDMEGLGKVFHKDAVIKVNGEHEYSGEYQGFDDWLNNFLVHLPTNYPNFDLSILKVHLIFVQASRDIFESNKCLS